MDHHEIGEELALAIHATAKIVVRKYIDKVPPQLLHDALIKGLVSVLCEAVSPGGELTKDDMELADRVMSAVGYTNIGNN